MLQKLLSLLRTFLFPRIQDVFFVATLVAVTIQGPHLLNGDGDLGRHLTFGNYILDNWKIPTQDIFSHTMTGARLVPHEWLAEVAFSSMYRWMGLSGVVLLTAFLITLTFTCTYREMLKRNVFRILALAMAILAASASSLHWLTRPHIFTFLFAALWAYQLEDEKSRLWLFPLLMLIWANTHGAFIAGFVIWGAHVAGWLWEYLHKQSTGETGRRLAIIGISSFAVTFINPAGWRLWDTSVGYLGSRFLVDRTVEYQSPNFHTPSTWPFLIILALYLLAVGFGGRPRPHDSILVAGWTIMSLYSARNIPLFAIIAAPYLGAALQSTLEKASILQQVDQTISKVESNSKGILWPLLGVAALLFTTYLHPSPANDFMASKFPVQAVNWLEVHPQEGNLFNSFVWGGYILYRRWPAQTVFIDGQTDFYGEKLTREYEQVITLGEGWQGVLTKYDVAWVLVQPGQPLVPALEKLGWVRAYEDATAAILHKP